MTKTGSGLFQAARLSTTSEKSTFFLGFLVFIIASRTISGAAGNQRLDTNKIFACYQYMMPNARP